MLVRRRRAAYPAVLHGELLSAPARRPALALVQGADVTASNFLHARKVSGTTAGDDAMPAASTPGRTEATR